MLLQPSPLAALAGGAAALAMAMGIGRFAYTPILPLMQQQTGLSDAMAGYLGAVNYLGYLVGALALGVRPPRARSGAQRRAYREGLLRLGLVLSVVTTGVMGCIDTAAGWMPVRFASGIASALIFVLASSLALEALSTQGRRSWAGLFYGGVGAGIALAGVSVPWLDRIGGWRAAWLGMAGLALPLAGLSWLTLRERRVQRAADPGDERRGAAGTAGDGTEPRAASGLLPWLTAAYGLEGFGYIVTGTFLVSIVERTLGGRSVAMLSWILVGLAAVPSNHAWTWLAERRGYPATLVAVFAVQAAGVALPALWTLPTAVLAGALLFGGTFMAIPSLTFALARTLRPDQSVQVIGRLTALYGAGQVIGPAAAGLLAVATGTYYAALWPATAAIALGAVLLIAGQRRAGTGRQHRPGSGKTEFI